MSKGSGRRPTDAAHAVTCAEAGHAMPDIRGRCFRCGALWFPPSPPMVPDPEYVTEMRTPGPEEGEAFRVITPWNTVSSTPTPEEPT